MIIVYAIIAVSILMSIAAFQSPDLMNRWLMKPYAVKHGRQWYRFLTSGFIHANWPHLLINMFVFYSFSYTVLYYFHSYFENKAIYYFVLLYIGAMIIADIPTFIRHQNDSWYASLGASGAVSGITFANVLLEPKNPIYLMGVLKMPAIVFGVAYLAYSHYMSRRGGDNINHSAHFYGAVFGVLFTLLLRPNFAVDFIDKLLSR